MFTVNEDDSQEQEKKVKRSAISEILVHPNWRFDTQVYDFDVAVVSLVAPVTLSNTLQPICLPSFNIEKFNKAGNVVGWGRDEHWKLYNKKAAEVQSHVGALRDCGASEQIFTSNEVFCGVNNAQTKSQCLAGPGSGYYTEESDQVFEVKGIATRANENEEHQCILKKSSLFTDVAKYVSWIERAVKESMGIKWKNVAFKCDEAVDHW